MDLSDSENIKLQWAQLPAAADKLPGLIHTQDV